MGQPLYDLYITGKLVDGISPEVAQENFAQLFKTSSAKVARYFTGNPSLFKRGIEKPEALKYKAAIHKAGILVAFKAHKTDLPQAATNTAKTQSLAQSAPVQPATLQTSQPSPQPSPQQQPSQQTSNLSIAPVGSDVLMPNEKSEFVEADIDTSSIKMVSAFMEVEPEVKEVPPAPNTSYISVAAAGEDLLIDKPEPAPPLPLNLDDLTLAPAGAQLEQLQDDLPLLEPDISALDIAPPGVDLLEGTKKPTPPKPPDTSHLSVSGE